jgi:hypothetical protein
LDDIRAAGGVPIIDRKAPGAPVTMVILDSPQTNDKTLQCLSKIKKLKSLWLANARITNGGLTILKKLPQLEELIITNCPIDCFASVESGKTPRSG